MQLTFTELFGFLGILSSIVAGVWVIINRFAKMEGCVGALEGRVGALEGRVGALEERVGRLEEKIDEILFYLAPRYKRKKMRHLYRRR